MEIAQTASVIFAFWGFCGLVAYSWIKNHQEYSTWYSETHHEWYTTYRAPTPEMVRKRFYAALLGPIALVLLALIVINDC